LPPSVVTAGLPVWELCLPVSMRFPVRIDRILLAVPCGLPIRAWGHQMKKTYEKPVLEKRQKLSNIVAIPASKAS
jgi:hypothetical protein